MKVTITNKGGTSPVLQVIRVMDRRHHKARLTDEVNDGVLAHKVSRSECEEEGGARVVEQKV